MRELILHRGTNGIVKDLFPIELWTTLDPSDRCHAPKRLHISTRTRLDRFFADEDDEGDDEDRNIGDDDNADPEDEDERRQREEADRQREEERRLREDADDRRAVAEKTAKEAQP